jgi:uncharacterized protein YbjQ (UPF0145 family)
VLKPRRHAAHCGTASLLVERLTCPNGAFGVCLDNDSHHHGQDATRIQAKEAKMVITTTPTVEGHPIEEYLGVVTGEAILGAHIGRDIMASLTDIVGGRSAEYEEEVRKARTIALEEMAAEAERKEANAIVGVDLDYEVIRQGMLMVSVSGTAVRIG